MEKQLTERQKEFVRAVAEYLTSCSAEKSILLQMGKPDAKAWAKARSIPRAPGWATADEMEQAILELLYPDA